MANPNSVRTKPIAASRISALLKNGKAKFASTIKSLGQNRSIDFDFNKFRLDLERGSNARNLALTVTTAILSGTALSQILNLGQCIECTVLAGSLFVYFFYFYLINFLYCWGTRDEGRYRKQIFSIVLLPASCFAIAILFCYVYLGIGLAAIVVWALTAVLIVVLPSFVAYRKRHNRSSVPPEDTKHPQVSVLLHAIPALSLYLSMSAIVSWVAHIHQDEPTKFSDERACRKLLTDEVYLLWRDPKDDSLDLVKFFATDFQYTTYHYFSLGNGKLSGESDPVFSGSGPVPTPAFSCRNSMACLQQKYALPDSNDPKYVAPQVYRHEIDDGNYGAIRNLDGTIEYMVAKTYMRNAHASMPTAASPSGPDTLSRVPSPNTYFEEVTQKDDTGQYRFQWSIWEFKIREAHSAFHTEDQDHWQICRAIGGLNEENMKDIYNHCMSKPDDDTYLDHLPPLTCSVPLLPVNKL